MNTGQSSCLNGGIIRLTVSLMNLILTPTFVSLRFYRLWFLGWYNLWVTIVTLKCAYVAMVG